MMSHHCTAGRHGHCLRWPRQQAGNRHVGLERSKPKFYAVAKGKYTYSLGIYTTWAETNYHVSGCSGARYSGHKTSAQAEQWLEREREDRGGVSVSSPALETPRRARDVVVSDPSSSSASSRSAPVLLPAPATSAPKREVDYASRSWFICATPAVDREYLDPEFYDRVPGPALGGYEDDVQFYHVPAPWSNATKFYAVARGRTPGVYAAYNGPHGALKQVEGFPKNDYKKCGSEEQAWDYIRDYHTKRKMRKARKKSMLVGGVRDDWEDFQEALLDAAARRLAAQMSPSSSRASSPLFALDVDVHVAGAYAVDTHRAGIGLFFGIDDWHNSSERCPAGWETPERAEILAVIRALQAAPLGPGSLVIRTSSFDSIVNLAYCGGTERAYINERLALRRHYEQTVRIVSGYQPNSPAIALAHHGTKMTEREDVDWGEKLARLAMFVHDDETGEDELEAVLRASFAKAGPRDDSADCNHMVDGQAPRNVPELASEDTYAQRAHDQEFAGAASTSDEDASAAETGDLLANVPLPRAAVREHPGHPHLAHEQPVHDPCSINASDDEFPDDDSSWMDDAPADWLGECERRPHCSTPVSPLRVLGPESTDVRHQSEDEFEDWTDALPVGLLSQYAFAVEPETSTTRHRGFGAADNDDEFDSASAWIDAIPGSQLAAFDVPASSSPAVSPDESDWIDTLSVDELDLLNFGHV